MNQKRLEDYLKNICGTENVMSDEPMKNHTSFKLGGPADFLVKPCSVEQIRDIISLCKGEDIPLYIMGNGTNLVVRDKGIRGVVVKTHGCLNKYCVCGSTIEAYAGALLSDIAEAAWIHGLTGMEFASGIPGTLGGAVFMNAGAYDGEMKDIVLKTEYLDNKLEIRVIENEKHQFGYRSSVIQKEGGIVLKSFLELKEGVKSNIKERMDDLNQRRRDKQPLELPSAGSVFRRPVGHYTGKLVEECGLRGYRIGGAQVSTKHCGFIVNIGGALAEDVINLIEHIQQSVYTAFGVQLQTEVRIIGEE